MAVPMQDKRFPLRLPLRFASRGWGAAPGA
jgi:hypothetical protein